MKNINEMTLAELKKYASELGLEKVSAMKKDALLELVAGKENEKKAAEAAKTEKKAPARAEKKPAPKKAEEKAEPVEAKPAQEKKAGRKPAPKKAEEKAEPVEAKPVEEKPAQEKKAGRKPAPKKAEEKAEPVEAKPVEEKAVKAEEPAQEKKAGRKPAPKKPVKKAEPAEEKTEKTEKAEETKPAEEKKENKEGKKDAISARERLEQFAMKRAQQPGGPMAQQPGGPAMAPQRPPMPPREGQRPPMPGRPMPPREGQRPPMQPAPRPVQRPERPERPERPVQEAPAQQAPAANPNIVPVQPTDGTITPEMQALDSGITKQGILEVMPDGFAFIRCDNFLPGENDVYVSPTQVRRFNIKTGDIIEGNMKIKAPNEKFSALLYIKNINGLPPAEALKRPKFEDLTPVFPNERIHLETPGCGPAMRMVDLLSPIGKGQRGMIVSQPKAGKTTLLKQIAKAITTNHPDMHLMILLIDERPEEVTDMKESISGPNVEVIYSTFDELPEKHKRVSEMVIERAKRLVEHKKDVVILLDSITRLARAYNLTCQSSGRTLSGGLDPAALYMPKRFFGAARNMKEGGSLTILATALVDTGSRMDDVVFEEFKGTGNMELVLDRNLSERRIFPAIDLPRSGTRRDDLLLNPTEQEANYIMRRAFSGSKGEEAVERIINMFAQTRKNSEFCEVVKKLRPMPNPMQGPAPKPQPPQAPQQ